MKQGQYSYLIVCLFSIGLSLLYIPPYGIFFDDKEIFQYAGLVIKKGLVPYKDFFDHKPPLIFFINYLGSLLGTYGLWLIDALLVLWASLRFLKVNLLHRVVFPVLLPLIFNLVLRNSTLSFGYGMTREYTTIFLLLACCSIIINSRHKNFYLGIFGALIFFFQQDHVVLLAPFLAYSLYEDLTRTRFIKVVLNLLAGSGVVLLPILVFFWANNALSDFWQSAFMFNRQWYTTEERPGLRAEIVTLKNCLYLLKFEIVFIGTLLMGTVSFFIGNKRKGLLIAALITIPLSFISEFLSGKLAIGNALLYYYLLPLAATLPLTLFVVFAFTEKSIFQHKVHQAIYGALFTVNLVLTIAMFKANYHRYPQDYISKSPELKYLETKQVNDYSLYVFDNANYVYAYNQFGVLAPSKWVYHFFWSWYPAWDKDGTIIRNITADLKNHRTQYLIYNPSQVKFKQEANHQTWKRFVDSFYRPVPGTLVWELKK